MADRLDPAKVKAGVQLERLIAQKVELKGSGGSLVGLCPFHQEKTGSFTVWPARQTWKCFGCNESGDAISWIQKTQNLSYPEALAHLAGVTPADLKKPAPKSSRKPPKVWDTPPAAKAHHYYLDADRQPIGCVCRRITAFPVKAKCMMYKRVSGGWQAGELPPNRPPYRWTDVADRPEKAIIVVEGENTADYLDGLGLLAVSWAEGTSAVARTDWKFLAGRTVAVVADRDDGGRAAADQVAEILRQFNCIVDCYHPPGDDGKDMGDLPEVMQSKQTAVDWILKQPKSKPALLQPADRAAAEPAPAPPPPPPPPPEEKEKPASKKKPRKKAKPVDFSGKSEWADNAGWRLLGINAESVVLYQRDAKRVMMIPQSLLYRASTLYTMNPDVHWWTEVTGGTLNITAYVHAAANAILQSARKLGIYQPEIEVGRGCWKDANGGIWWHMGSCLLTPDGKEVDLDQAPDAICQAARALHVRPAPNGSGTDLSELWNSLAGYRWRSAADHAAFMGWIAASCIGGVLKWRPHVWLISPAGWGKSFLMQEIIFPLIEVFSKTRHGAGETTASAFRRMVGNESLPFALDEARKPSRSGADKFEELLPILRLASDGKSGISIADGSGDKVKTIIPRCAIMMASSVGHHLGDQDASRITTIRLDGVEKDIKEWLPIQKEILKAISKPDDLISSIMASTHKILDLIDRAHSHLTSSHSTSTRRADQMSALIGAAAWAKNPANAVSEIPALTDQILTLSDEVLGNSGLDFWYHLLAVRLDLDDFGKSSLQSLLSRSAVSGVAQKRANEFGVGVDEEWVAVNPFAPQLREALVRSAWEGGDPKTLLLDLPGAHQLDRHKPRWWLGQKRCWPIMLPIELLGQLETEPLTVKKYNQTANKNYKTNRFPAVGDSQTPI